ncbi:RloB domain-containing protein [Methylovulum psychrotolerans]|uniref:RloB family protein n=1 Tax=Methylovulum psychrotolerans TaxID=1704499 RepID=UPI001BFFAD10|nr:RloB family protein [Methylovulum psychrotolerans]MBT9096653.1 RloB domain-containing protein [Methylovulum psychrotolerans]
MARTAKSFSRAKPSLLPQPTVLVICEDSKSGKRYLEDASVHFKVKVQVEICHCGKTDPLNIVKEAIRRQSKFDRVFCAIDRDSHETFTAALGLARDHKKIDLIVSYPCFEFWLLLHFGYHRKPYNATEKQSAAALLIKDLRGKPGFENYEKGDTQSIKSDTKSLFKSLLPQLATAQHIAPKILAEAQASGELNPSTQLHELLNDFAELAKPQKIARSNQH